MTSELALFIVLGTFWDTLYQYIKSNRTEIVDADQVILTQWYSKMIN